MAILKENNFADFEKDKLPVQNETFRLMFVSNMLNSFIQMAKKGLKS